MYGKGCSLAKITFLGGVNEIGGNCFLVEDKDTKVLLDFGLRYKIRQKYFEEYLQPRTSCGLADVLTMGLIPDMPDFYRKDLLAMMGCECSPDPCLDGVLLSTFIMTILLTFLSWMREFQYIPAKSLNYMLKF